jgi:hypothetical protein
VSGQELDPAANIVFDWTGCLQTIVLDQNQHLGEIACLCIFFNPEQADLHECRITNQNSLHWIGSRQVSFCDDLAVVDVGC